MRNTPDINNLGINELKQLASIAIEATNAIILLDKHGALLWANKGFEELYGFTIEEFQDHFSDDNSEFIKILNEIDSSFFTKNPSLSFSRNFLTKKYQRKWVQSTFTPIKSENEITKYVVIETDITQQKEVEEELVQRWENTQTLTEHLESVKDYIEEQIQDLAEQKKALQVAKDKSEEVLNKVLPYEVAIQLKKKGYASPRHYKKVTILNLNIRNFIALSDTIPIEELVSQLHETLTQLDGVLETHYVEKIKTSGGIYLGAGGVPLRNRSNPIDVALAALKIKEILAKTNIVRKQKKLDPFETSVGVHTGKVIAGVVGKNKLSYDIWGDTVNIASTIEHNIPLNDIQISEITYREIKAYFICEPTEKLILGTAEDIQLYNLLRLKPEFSADAAGVYPNQKFMNILSKL